VSARDYAFGSRAPFYALLLVAGALFELGNWLLRGKR
jgi:hypothetical protein